MFNIILYQPEIPPNTGNIIRLCANTGSRLHLIRPLGFDLEDKQLRRAGLDYHEYASVRVHSRLEECLEELGSATPYVFTTRGSHHCHEARFMPGDSFLFGPESRGLPDDLIQATLPERRLRIPMLPGVRSLNLSNSVAVAVYEAWRQCGFRMAE